MKTEFTFDSLLSLIPENFVQDLKFVAVQVGGLSGELWFYSKALVVLVVFCLFVYHAIDLLFGG